MTLVRRVARPLMGALFVVGGLNAYRHPGPRAATAAPVVEKLAPPLGLPNDPELFVRANAATQMGAGTLFGLNAVPRLSAAALVVSMLPTTVAGHRFWTEQDPEERARQLTQFLKNAAIIGGLLLATVDTEGKPGLAWRANRAAADAKRGLTLTGKDAKRTVKMAQREARHAAKDAQRAAKLVAATAQVKLT